LTAAAAEGGFVSDLSSPLIVMTGLVVPVIHVGPSVTGWRMTQGMREGTPRARHFLDVDPRNKPEDDDLGG
jgi:hypothetical protein